MRTSMRVLVIAAFAMVVSIPLFAIVPGPELDPGSSAAGVTLLATGTLYLIERYRRRR